MLNNISFDPGATEKGQGDAARTSDRILINAFPGRKESYKQFWLPLSAACSVISKSSTTHPNVGTASQLVPFTC